MWKELIQPFSDMIRLSRSTAEEREELLDTVTRLRRNTKTSTAVATAPAGFAPQTKSVSLFESIKAPGTSAMTERKRVGHWCTLSVPASREETSKRVERAYDGDFRTVLEPQDLNLETFLSQAAGKKAIQSYILKNHEPKAFVPAPMQPIAQNNNIEDTLLNLAYSDEEAVRISVASNEYLPLGAMWMLVDDPSSSVKVELIENPHISIAMLERLSGDFDGKVSRKAESKLRSLYKEHFSIATGNLSADEEEEAESANKTRAIHAA